ncbi:hypothetical protein CR513_15346, partial [Mucuna pruriens]
MVGNHRDHCNYGKDPLERTLQDYFILAIGKDPLEKTLQDYFISAIVLTNNIYYLLVETSSFELNPTLISMIGLPTKESLAHLKKFLRFVNTIRKNNVPIDTIHHLRLFPFSLADRALEWLTTLPNGVITT